jgi:hypothetical protein
MFERFTERARRVIFFARYEASVYGSTYIDTEHLLLGWLREDQGLAKTVFARNSLAEIRAEIDGHLTRKVPIPTSVEIPLSAESKRVLNLATKESENLGSSHIGTEHLLLGMLAVEGSVAAHILQEQGVTAADVRERLSKSEIIHDSIRDGADKPRLTLESFFTELKQKKSGELMDYFAKGASFVDVHGKRWDRQEISQNFETLFAPYAKKNAAPVIEHIAADAFGLPIVSVLWKNAVLASMERVWMHRMSTVLIRERAAWRILLMHTTAVQPH